MKKKLHFLADFMSFILKFSNFQIRRSAPRSYQLILRLCFILAFSHFKICTFAQDTSHIRISLLTCTPGEELYSTFGHTAIRLTDSNSVTDNVFNYGTFNFGDPGFYIKFIRGKLPYYLSVEKFQSNEKSMGFKDEYQEDNRGITEQVLNMDAAGKIALMEALYENAKEANRYYKYDFFLDNCTTRTRDVLLKFNGSHPTFKPVMPAGTKFRQAIHQYLDKNEKYWSKLGIDILLGARTDAVMTIAQSQFLPDNLMKSFDGSNQNHQLVLSSASLYPLSQQENQGSFLTPVFVFSLLLVVIVLLSFSTNIPVKMFLQGFDGIFFFLIGVLGILLIFMWVATDHSMTKDNYNLLWAWPTNILAAFFINSKKAWAKKYFGFHAAALVIVLLSWFFLPQQMNNSLVPVVLLLIFRSGIKYLTRVS